VLIGSLLLAGATTLPEIMTGVSAVRMGAQDLTVGDLTGSCLMNLMILGLLDALYYARHGRGLLPGTAFGHARAATLGIVLMGIAGVAVVQPTTLAIGHVGIGPIVLALVYVLGSRVLAFQHHQDAQQAAQAVEDSAQSCWARLRLRWVVAAFAGGAAIVTVAAPRLADAGTELAEASGLGQTLFGVVFLAIVTSLPELVASLAACRIGAFDLAVGNVLGSNAFNVAVLFILDCVDTSGPMLPAVEPIHAVTLLSAIVATGVVLQIVISPRAPRVWGVSPDALAIIATVLAGIGVVYVAR